jgi:molybdopterin-guanine dinucleotide biosynthesis protein A
MNIHPSQQSLIAYIRRSGAKLRRRLAQNARERRSQRALALGTVGDRLSGRGSVLGVILAGGKSTRMGFDKAFVDLHGRPLIAHAIARLSPQVDSVAISANGDPSRFALFAARVLADSADDRDAGPLAGVAAALAFAEAEGWALVATAPCDAPFAPVELVARLAKAMIGRGVGIALVEGPRGLEPLFALWRADLSAALRLYLSQGGRSVRDFIASESAARVPFIANADEDPFANLNNPAELDLARARPDALKR